MLQSFHKYYFTLLLMSGCIAPTTMMADDNYAVKVDFDKKVINVDSLALPQSFRAIGILRLLPEILERPGSTLSANYDIQIDHMSLGDASDAALAELQLASIEKIEVSESPLSSYQHNGQGGSINIILRKKPKGDDDNVWGNATIDYNYETDVYPFVHVGYQKSKLSIVGTLMGEYSDSEIPTYTSHDKDYMVTTNDDNFRSQLARVCMEYKPNSKDKFQLNLSENSSRITDNMTLDAWRTTEYVVIGAHYTKKKSTTLSALTNYEHTFNNKSKLSFEAQYNYIPGKNTWDEKGVLEEKDFHTNSVSGQVEYETSPFFVSGNRSSKLTVGLINNTSWYNMNYHYISSGTISANRINIDTHDYSLHLMPYAKFMTSFGAFKAMAAGEYQYYRYYVARNNSLLDDSSLPSYTRVRRDFTGKLMFCWQMTSNKHLRLIFDRKLQRPSTNQIYPYLNFNAEGDNYQMGNTELNPMLTHEVSLDYITNLKWGENKLTFNIGASYNYVNDIIDEVIRDGKSGSGGLGMTLQYHSYENAGNNSMLIGDIMALYSYKSFSLSFSANAFHNNQHMNGECNHHDYYNISLLPAFSLKNGWMASVNILYYSKLTTNERVQDDCLATQFNIGKNFGNWNVHILGKVAINGKVNDTTGDIVNTYSLVRNSIGAGIMYRF